MTAGHQVNRQQPEARRALVLHDRQLVVDLIELTLNHGLFVVRAARSLAEAEAILTEWHPHMTVVDMDSVPKQLPSAVVGSSGAPRVMPAPVRLFVTRRVDDGQIPDRVARRRGRDSANPGSREPQATADGTAPAATPVPYMRTPLRPACLTS